MLAHPRGHARAGVAAFAILVISFLTLARYRQYEAAWSKSYIKNITPLSEPEKTPLKLGQAPNPPLLSPELAIADHNARARPPIRPGVPPRVDGVIIMGRTSQEDTSWVAGRLPEWQRAIYTVDTPFVGEFRLPAASKSKEAMSYLTYVIDHYHRLPETLVFLHSHEGVFPGGWHTDAPDNSNVWSVRRLCRERVQRQGYVNLRCAFVPGCLDGIQPLRDPPDHSDNKAVERAMPVVWWELFNDTDVPRRIAVPCCAQFAVSRAQVLKRPWDDYVRFRQWVIDYQGGDPGRILEYLWHIIFGMEAVMYVVTRFLILPLFDEAGSLTEQQVSAT